jgi:hypothetical protein
VTSGDRETGPGCYRGKHKLHNFHPEIYNRILIITEKIGERKGNIEIPISIRIITNSRISHLHTNHDDKCWKHSDEEVQSEP